MRSGTTEIDDCIDLQRAQIVGKAPALQCLKQPANQHRFSRASPPNDGDEPLCTVLQEIGDEPRFSGPILKIAWRDTGRRVDESAALTLPGRTIGRNRVLPDAALFELLDRIWNIA